MERRERHLRILENFGSERTRFHREQIVARLGMSAFTDEAVEAIARHLLHSHRQQQRFNREWREKRRATG